MAVSQSLGETSLLQLYEEPGGADTMSGVNRCRSCGWRCIPLCRSSTSQCRRRRKSCSFPSKIMGAFPSAGTEQVIEVPKILDNIIPQRAGLMAPQVAEKLVGIPSPPFLILPFLLLYHVFRRWRKSWWKPRESGRRCVDVFRQLTGQSAEQIATLQALQDP